MVAGGRGGRIIFTSSVHAQMGFPTMSVYGATKSAIRALCESMAIELAPHGIRVNHIGPGWVLSQLNDPSPALASEEVTQRQPRDDPDRGPRRRPLRDGTRGGLLRVLRRRLRDRRLPPCRRRLRRGEVLMARVTVTGLPGATGDAIRRTLEERATLDTTVAGTGEQPQKPFLEVTQADWEAAVAAVRDAFLATQAAARRGDSRILLISSSPAIRPVHGASLTATTGAFLHTIGQVAAVELGPSGTTVNVVAPGFVGRYALRRRACRSVARRRRRTSPRPARSSPRRLPAT